MSDFEKIMEGLKLLSKYTEPHVLTTFEILAVHVEGVITNEDMISLKDLGWYFDSVEEFWYYHTL